MAGFKSQEDRPAARQKPNQGRQWAALASRPRCGCRGKWEPRARGQRPLPHRPSAFRVLTILLLALPFLGSCASREDDHFADPVARNVLLISIDTLRADHLSCYGYEAQTSPHIDDLARRGALFLNAYSSSSWTVPSHATMLTGLDPIVHGALNYRGTGPLPEEYLTLAEILQAKGFRTAAFTGGGYVSPAFGMSQGFETFVTYGRRFELNLLYARRWLAANADKPFFLFLHGYNVHKPYQPPAPFDRKFAGGYAGDYDIMDFQPNNPRPSPEDLRFVISQYDGEIGYVDELLGDFLAHMERSGVLANTIVIVTSDHGEEFYEHGSVDHIHTLYDELIRVPLIIYGPQIKPAVFRGQVGIIDILPTVLGLLGLGSAPPTQGYDLAPYLRNSIDTMSHDIYSFTGFSDYPYHLFALRTPKWKLILWNLAGMKTVDLSHDEDRELYTYKFRTDRQEDFTELYLLSEDPGEKHDLAAIERKMEAAMSRRLADRIHHDTSLRRHQATSPPALAPADIEALRALGYLE